MNDNCRNDMIDLTFEKPTGQRTIETNSGANHEAALQDTPLGGTARINRTQLRWRVGLLVGLLYAATRTAQGDTNRIVLNKVDTPTSPVPAVAGFTLDDKHTLEPGDILSFQILEDKHPPVSLGVADSSELEVPYLGRVSVAGKTCRQMAAELKTLLEKDYYYRATVIVGLNSVNKVRGQVFVWGQVRNQGPIDVMFNQKLTVAEAILRAGGFGDFADKKKVRVVRKGSTGSGGTDYVINVADIVEKGKPEKDLVLEPGDFVTVPSRLINF